MLSAETPNVRTEFFQFSSIFLQKRAFVSAGGFAPSALVATIRCSGGGRLWGGCARTHPGGAEGLKDWRFPLSYTQFQPSKNYSTFQHRLASLCVSGERWLKGLIFKPFRTVQPFSVPECGLSPFCRPLVHLLSPPLPGWPSFGPAFRFFNSAD